MAESRYLKNRIEKRLPHFFDDAFLLMVCKMHFLEEFEIKDVTTIEFEEPVFLNDHSPSILQYSQTRL